MTNKVLVNKQTDSLILYIQPIRCNIFLLGLGAEEEEEEEFIYD